MGYKTTDSKLAQEKEEDKVFSRMKVLVITVVKLHRKRLRIKDQWGSHSKILKFQIWEVRVIDGNVTWDAGTQETRWRTQGLWK